eukprot:6193004-Pleurochrysis_carterae.AAC.6
MTPRLKRSVTQPRTRRETCHLTMIPATLTLIPLPATPSRRLSRLALFNSLPAGQLHAHSTTTHLSCTPWNARDDLSTADRQAGFNQGAAGGDSSLKRSSSSSTAVAAYTGAATASRRVPRSPSFSTLPRSALQSLLEPCSSWIRVNNSGVRYTHLVLQQHSHVVSLLMLPLLCGTHRCLRPPAPRLQTNHPWYALARSSRHTRPIYRRLLILAALACGDTLTAPTLSRGDMRIPACRCAALLRLLLYLLGSAVRNMKARAAQLHFCFYSQPSST